MAITIKAAMKLNGRTDPTGFRMIAALITGAINEVPCAYLEFAARNKKLDLGTYVGKEMGFVVTNEEGRAQPFWGTCISLEAKGNLFGESIFVAEIRPWLWFLSRARNNRIYQELTTTQIIQDVLGEYGFSGDLKIKNTGNENNREYCVQYRETDLDFIKRLMEDEGCYFYFEHGDGVVSMILADQPSTHTPVTPQDVFTYAETHVENSHAQMDTWKKVEKVVTGKVSLRDYDFTKPSTDLTVRSDLQSGSHNHKAYEAYSYPGGYKEVSAGDDRADALIEEEAAGHQVWSGSGDILNLNVGRLFEIEDHPHHQKKDQKTFLATEFSQFIDVAGSGIEGGSRIKADLAALDPDLHSIVADSEPEAGANNADQQTGSGLHGYFHTRFNAVLKSNPYRGPGKTKRPVIAGVQTAFVTGAQGDEIAVDQYGRIKVQFHWDRDGQNDDTSSCWVRTMMPWTGKGWGTIALPRIGQEVVIQFEEGDPDRPLCIGMLYNAETMPPYELPANATRSGTKTNSSKEGGGYNELMFEDKKGDELVRFMAEKDYVQNVQNQAHVKVGYDHPTDVKKAQAQADKSMKLEVQKHLDEFVETGDHSMSILDGKQTLLVEKDKKETINGKSTLDVRKDKIVTVTGGDWKQTIDSGNIVINASMGKINMEAAQSITLAVGGSEVKIDQSGVSIKGMTIKIEGSILVDVKGMTTKVVGDVATFVKGTMVMINSGG